MEDVRQAKQAWTHHVQEAEALGSADTELGQELKQLKEKDRVKTMFSLLTRIGVVVSLRGKREKVFFEKDGVGFITYCNRVYKRRETGGEWSLDTSWKNLICRRW